MTERRFGYRWTICGLLFVVTTINYVDRQVLSILAPTLQRELGWSETDYGDIVSWFSFVYAFGFLIAGRTLDRIGVKRGFAFAVVTWSDDTEARRRRVPGWENRILDGVLSPLSTRDWHVFPLAFALAGRLDLLVLGAAVGAHVFWVATLLILLRALRRADAAARSVPG